MRDQRRHTTRRLLLLLILFCSSTMIWSHPHMRIYPSLEFEVKHGEFTGLWVDWEFDTMFSLSVISSFDADGNGRFSRSETKQVHDHAFRNLENFGYFISLRSGDRVYVPSEPTDFAASQDDGILSYRFFISFDSWDITDDIRLTVFDPTYFCAVKYRDSSISVSGKGSLPSYTLEQNDDHPVYYNPLGTADDVTVYTEWEKGLKTAYPEEAHVWF